jgi:hypothetical protein
MYRQIPSRAAWPLPELNSAHDLLEFFLNTHANWFTDATNSLCNNRSCAYDWLMAKIVQTETRNWVEPITAILLEESEKIYLWNKFSTEFFDDFQYVPDMLEYLRDAVLQLQAANRFKSSEGWESLYVDYEKPFVSRLWTPVTVRGEKCRLFLHRIHACKREESLYHPHPWPSAMVLCDQGYETGLGYGDPNKSSPPLMGPFYLPAWSAYQMASPYEWHYVRPIHDCYTIMITGEPFKLKLPKREIPPQRPLTDEEKKGLIWFFGGTAFHTIEHVLEVLDTQLKVGNAND